MGKSRTRARVGGGGDEEEEQKAGTRGIGGKG